MPQENSNLPLPHVPVMVDEVLQYLNVKPGDTVVDGTFGAGGHARKIAEQLKGQGQYIAIDRDPEAVERFATFAQEVAPLKTRLLSTTFPAGMRELVAEGVSAAAVILDVGVSSMQLDQPQRGFAYSHDAPLDMRMDPNSGESAADLLAHAEASELEYIFREYGEEKWAARIAKRIIERRENDVPVRTTTELVDIILDSLPHKGRKQKGGHPAKRVFQALRIAVNDELGMLDQGLDEALNLLANGGQLVVLTFHSLEDRMVKRRFEQWAGQCACSPLAPVCTCGVVSKAERLHRGVVRPSDAELVSNPRSASTKLRAVRKNHE